MTPPIDRNVQFKILLSEEEKAALDDLADTRGLTPTDFVRQLLRREQAAGGGRTPRDSEPGLSDRDRLMLVNQFSILKAIEKTKDYDEVIQVLREGYEIFYREGLLGLHDPVSDSDCRFVLDVLSLYRAIELYKEQTPSDKDARKAPWAHFLGFDGNNESGYMSFARFLIKTQRKFQEQLVYEKVTDEYNSHAPTLSMYREMLTRWTEMRRPLHLTKESVRKILPRFPSK